MTQIPRLAALYESSLASALSAAGTSFTLVSGTDRDGNALSGPYGFVISEGSANEEFVLGTVSGTTVTIVKRGLDADAPETEVSTNKKSHRRGESVKITDYPILAYLRNALAGQSGYELPAFLKYVTGIGNPTDDLHLVTKAYADAILTGGTGIPNRIVVAGTAGATIADGNLIYFDDTDNEWKLCDADTASTVENVLLGIAQGAGTDGVAIANGVLLVGVDDAQSGLTIGAPYYASNTAGGLSTSPGTKEVSVGWGKSATELYFFPRYNQQLTEDQQDALAGSLGTPSSTNKFFTQDSGSEATIDQAQVTQNATVAVGETDATTKKLTLWQSFVPSRTKFRGAKLYKSADTGTFTGTVTISLRANSGSSPDITDLATKVFTNVQWLALPVGEFEAVFSTEYGVTPGSTYWIGIACSTGDTSNHPNLGTNSAGGYSSGSVKYFNTTDTYVAITTIDLYFETLEGIKDQVVRSGSDGFIRKAFLDYENIGLEFMHGASGATHVKTYRSFNIPMIGDSGAAAPGAWVPSSADITFNAALAAIGGTGADKVYYDAIFPYMEGAGNTTVRFSSSTIVVMDYWALLPTSSVDTMFGFIDTPSGTTITYNQTAEEAICFTTHDGALYGHVCTGAAATTTAIPGITVSTPHNYRIVADLINNIAYFYVDGLLKLSISTNFPSSTQFLGGIMGRSATGSTYFSNPNLAIKTP